MNSAVASFRAFGAALALCSGAPIPALAQEPPQATPAPAPVTIRVRVLGAVAHAGNLELRAGDRLSMALQRAGVGDPAISDLSRVHLTRLNPTPFTPVGFYQINVSAGAQRGDLRSDPILKDGDRIYVPEVRIPGVKVIVPVATTG